MTNLQATIIDGMEEFTEALERDEPITEEFAGHILERITPSSDELRRHAKRFPPPPEWYDDELEPPPY